MAVVSSLTRIVERIHAARMALGGDDGEVVAMDDSHKQGQQNAHDGRRPESA
jgi:hypothetical protein